MIGLDEVLRYYEDQIECLRLVERAGRAGPIASARFANLTHLELGEKLRSIREELDRQVVLTLVASTEAILRRDFEARVSAGSPIGLALRRWAFTVRLPSRIWSRAGALEEELRNLSVRYGRKVELTGILDGWKRSTASANTLGAFKQLLKHRHWLAHGRYYKDPSGYQAPPDPNSAYAVIDSMMNELVRVRADFPLG